MKSNTLRLKLASTLEKNSKKTKQNTWKRISEYLTASGKNRPVVNVYEISRNTKEGTQVVVPGKVLGTGTIGHRVTVAAFSFSTQAREKITSSGGKCLSLEEFMKSAQSVKGVLILG